MKYSLSEVDNNVPVVTTQSERKPKRGSFVRHNKNALSLTNEIIPEISHESQEEDNKTVLVNGHLAGCNINRHLRFEQDNSDASQSKFPASRVISVIEEASV